MKEILDTEGELDRIDTDRLIKKHPIVGDILGGTLKIIDKGLLNELLAIDLKDFKLPKCSISLSIGSWVRFQYVNKITTRYYKFIKLALDVKGKGSREILYNSYSKACADNHSHIMRFLEEVFPSELSFSLIEESISTETSESQISQAGSHVFFNPSIQHSEVQDASVETSASSSSSMF